MSAASVPRQVGLVESSPGPIVIYDSGVGGLTVARHLVAQRPWEDLAYVADNGWFPYGDKSDLALRARIYSVLNAIVQTLRPRAVVIACNTASTAVAATLDDIADGVPVFTVVPPVESATRRSPDGKIVLLATPNTLRRTLVRRLIDQQPSAARIRAVGSMALVHLAETKVAGDAVAVADVEAAVAEFSSAEERNEVTGVILGCTHFPWLVEELRPVFPAATAWSDPARDIAEKVLAGVPVVPTASGAQHGRALYLTSPHNADLLLPVFARHGFRTGHHLPLAWDAVAPTLRTG